MIPIARPSIGEEELNQVQKVFASAWLGMGAAVFEFEQGLKEYLGAKNVIAVNTGTSALHIALSAFGIQPGDEVIVPSLTFAGSIQAIVACGARPLFCDVYAETLNMNIEDASAMITPSVKAIMPVHYGGLPCKMEPLLALAREKGIPVIEDAAHAFGAEYQGRKIGSFGDAVCFSFDPIKNITCGEGGAVALQDEAVSQEIIRKRILGIDRDTWNRYKERRSWFYQVVTPGFRYHMSNINAAIGLVQLKKADEFLARKRAIVRQYDRAFGDLPQVELLFRDYQHSAPFNYTIKVKDGRRDSLLEYLQKNGIGAGINYIPNHLQPLFKKEKTNLPVTEKVWEEIICLPLYSGLSDEEVETVITAVRRFFNG